MVIVGHGPSVLCGLGAVIDSHDVVVRLKQGLTKNQPPEHFGTRTDVISARSHLFTKEGVTFWRFPEWPDPMAQKWLKYYGQFRPTNKRGKPSTGLAAVFCAIEYANPESISLIGFDRLFKPTDECTGKWYEPRRFNKFGTGSHDQRAEAECLKSLPVKIIDLSKEANV
jgi:hypothetical protein